MRCRLLFFYVFLMFSYSALSQDSTGVLLRLKKHIEILASDSLQGRRAGTEYEKKASRYIISEFSKTTLKPYGKNWVHPFSFKDEDSLKKTAYNVIAYLDNKASKTIVIAAHYDHLGIGGTKSRSYGKKAIHNGADDNASGVAVFLELAKSLSENNLKNNYLFIAFSAHEEGLFGSKLFMADYKKLLPDIRLMLNIDMIGRMDTISKNLSLFTSGLPASIDSLAQSYCPQDIYLKIIKENFPESDHSAFKNKKIPCLFITTGAHEDYHKITDDAEKINYAGLLKIYDFLQQLIFDLDNSK